MSTALGNYLKSVRSQLKRTLRQVEATTGISNAHLHQIEKGTIEKPSSEILGKLADCYQIKLSYLLELTSTSNEEIRCKERLSLRLQYITATQIDEFSKKRESEGILPHLLRDLIFSTVDIDKLAMPVGNSIFMKGWDGIIRTKESNHQFVPEGDSFWELSRSKKISTKIRGDHEKRSEKPLEADAKTSTYVQVTFSRMERTAKNKLIEEMKIAHEWKDVRIYDAEDLEIWLEESPGVALGFAKKMGLFPNAVGIIPLEDFWSEWWHSTEPAIAEDLLIEAGKNIEDFTPQLRSTSGTLIKLKSNDWRLGVAFYFARLSRIDDFAFARSIISRSLVVNNEESFRLLASRKMTLNLIPNDFEAPVGEAKANGNNVVLISTNFSPSDLDIVGRVRTSVISEYLRNEGGLEQEKAYRISSSCHGNLAVLRLMLAEEGQIAIPLWATPEYASQVLPLVLLGGWNTDNPNDQKSVSEIAGMEFEKVMSFLKTIPQDNNRLYQEHNNSISFYQEYAFGHLIKNINQKHIERFLKIAKDIFCEIDSKYSLETEERHFAGLYQKGHPFSKKMRLGIATSLAIISNANISFSKSIKAQIDKSAVEILEQSSDWKFWASLSEMLMLIAEASPESFLNRVESIAEKNKFNEILDQTSSLGGCDYAPLLWSLELCAWDKKYFKRVTKILLMLVPFQNKKSNYVNQPSNSLWDIYRIWANQSNVSFTERMQVLKSLESDYENEIWNLVIRLIPRGHEMGSHTYRPRFWEIENNQEVETDNYMDMMNEIVNYVLYLVNKSPERWVDVIDIIPSLKPVSFQTSMLSSLGKLQLENLSEDKKNELWLKIENVLAHHLEFPDADWSMKGARISDLKKIYKKLSPSDPVKKWAKVFDSYFSHPEIEDGNHDYSEKQNKMHELRKLAYSEIKSIHGENTAVVLLDCATNLWILGNIASELDSDLYYNLVTRSLSHAKFKDFFYGFTSGMYNKYGDDWIKSSLLHEVFSDKKIAVDFFISLPRTFNIWKMISEYSESVEDQYWKSIGRMYLQNPDDIFYALEKLLNAKCPLDAFYTMAHFEKRKKEKSIPTNIMIEVLDAVMAYDFSEATEKSNWSMFDYYLEETLKELRQRDDVDRKKLAVIEWNFLPIFKYKKTPENLTEQVLTDPQLFIEILAMAYKKDDLTSESNINKESSKRAYQFFHDLKSIPGVDFNGNFDPDNFSRWFCEARSLAFSMNRVKAFDSVVGEILAYAPHDKEDSSWPHKIIRDVVEKYATNELLRGLSRGIFNRRGCYTKSMEEGGLQERELAKKYGSYADKCELLWPKLGSVFRQLEKNYLADAAQEDFESLLD